MSKLSLPAVPSKTCRNHGRHLFVILNLHCLSKEEHKTRTSGWIIAAQQGKDKKLSMGHMGTVS